MTGQPRFDPARSDAIRALLVQTVEQAPARDHRRHVRIAVIAVLAALLGGLGSGAVALAVTGGPFLGAPAEGPSVSATPDADPQPTATGSPIPSPEPVDAHPLVLSDAPIAPRDVAAPTPGGAWQLDLGGTEHDCEARVTYDVADGYALFQTGPDTPGDNPGPDCDYSTSRMSLTLVDTQRGLVTWTRQWEWSQSGYPPRVELLGTSGRAIVTTDATGIGPNEVIDVQTGEALAEFAPHLDGAPFVQYSFVSTPGASGEIVIGMQPRDEGGTVTGAPGVIERIDPRSPDRPVWTTTLDRTFVEFAPTVGDTTFAAFQMGRSDGSNSAPAVVDLTTGEVSERAIGTEYRFSPGLALRIEGSATADRIATALAPNGDHLWELTLPVGSSINLVRDPAQAPGAVVQNLYSGVSAPWLVIDGSSGLTLVDANTGLSVWTVAPGCDSPIPRMHFQLNTAAGTIVVPDRNGPTCSYDLARGALTAADTIPGDAWHAVGSSAAYLSSDGVGTAYDAVSGAVLWSVPTGARESWQFAGGHLVGWDGSRLVGIGQ